MTMKLVEIEKFHKFNASTGELGSSNSPWPMAHHGPWPMARPQRENLSSAARQRNSRSPAKAQLPPADAWPHLLGRSLVNKVFYRAPWEASVIRMILID